jgi:hypothetical protein
VPVKNLVSSEKVASLAPSREIRGLMIGRQLKVNYDLADPISDRLVEFLKQLRQIIDEEQIKPD